MSKFFNAFVSRNIFGHYAEEEKQVMHLIHNTYIANMETDKLPRVLRMDEHFEKPETTANEQDFDANICIGRLQDGFMSAQLGDLLRPICAFQLQHKKMYLNGPLHLLCEELKESLINISGSDSDVILRYIEKRLSYLRNLEMEERLAPIRRLLIRIRQLLGGSIRAIAMQEYANMVAREQFGKIIAHNNKLLRWLIDYLLFSFCKIENIPANCALDKLRNPDSEKIRETVATKAGKCLLHLLNTEELSAIFPVEEAIRNQQVAAIEMSETSVAFLDSFGMPSIPQALLTENLKIPVEYLRSRNSGIEKYFRKQAHLMNAFIRLHALAHGLAIFTELCKQAKELSGIGGDLLLYGMAGDQIKEMLNDYKQMTANIYNTITLLDAAADRYYDKLVGSSTKVTPWMQNYKRVARVKLEVHKEIKACNAAINIIVEQLESNDLDKMMQRARDKTNIFLKNTHNFSNVMSQLLQNRAPKTLSILSPAGVDVKPVVTPSQANTLALAGKNLDDDVLKLIYRNEFSRSSLIQLQKNHLKGAALLDIVPDLKVNMQLSKLNLWNNEIDDIGASACASLLLSNAPLSSLILNENKITTQGAELIAEALAQNYSLRHLDLGFNELGDRGVIALAQALRHNSTLEVLELWCTGVSLEAVKELVDVLNNDNTTLLRVSIEEDAITDVDLQPLHDLLKRNCELQNEEIAIVPGQYGI